MKFNFKNLLAKNNLGLLLLLSVVSSAHCMYDDEGTGSSALAQLSLSGTTVGDSGDTGDSSGAGVVACTATVSPTRSAAVGSQRAAVDDEMAAVGAVARNNISLKDSMALIEARRASIVDDIRCKRAIINFSISLLSNIVSDNTGDNSGAAGSPSAADSVTAPIRPTTPPAAATVTVSVPTSLSNTAAGVNTSPETVVHSARVAYAAAAVIKHDGSGSRRISASADIPAIVPAASRGDLGLSMEPSVALLEATALDHVEDRALSPRSEIRSLKNQLQAAKRATLALKSQLVAELKILEVRDAMNAIIVEPVEDRALSPRSEIRSLKNQLFVAERARLAERDVLNATILEKDSLIEKLTQCAWDKSRGDASKYFRAERIATAAGEASRPAGAASSKRVSFAAAPAEVVVAMPKPSPNSDWEPNFPSHPVPPFQYRQIKPVQSAAAPTGRAASTLASAATKIRITPWLLGIAPKDPAKTR